MEKVLDTLGIFDFGDGQYYLILGDEIIEKSGWLKSDKNDILTYTILDENTLILERNKENYDEKVSVNLDISDEGSSFSPRTFSLYMVEIPNCIVDHPKYSEWGWDDEDSIEWTLIDKNSLMLKRLGASSSNSDR